MNGDRCIARTVAQKAEEKGLKSVIEGGMKTLEPLFDEIDVGISHSSAMFDMQKVGPRLHIVVETCVTALARHRWLNDIDGDARMSGNVGKKPQNLIAAEFGDQVTCEFAVIQVGRTTSQGLLESLIVEFPMVMAMSRQIGIPETGVIFVRHGRKRGNVDCETDRVTADAIKEIADLTLRGILRQFRKSVEERLDGILEPSQASVPD